MIWRDLGHAQIGDHPEQHGVGLIGWQRADQLERAIERPCLLGIIGGRWGGGRRIAPALAVEVLLVALRRADVVDPASSRDREQPATEVGLVALEAVQPARHLDPHRRGEIFGIRHALAAEVAQQQVVVCPPQLTQRLSIAISSAPDHLLHSL